MKSLKGVLLPTPVMIKFSSKSVLEINSMHVLV